MRRLYIGPRHGAPPKKSVCGYRPRRDWVCRVRIGSRHPESGSVLAIRRLIWCVLLYCPGPAEGRMYGPELFYLYFYEAVGRAIVRHELPFYPDRGVVGPPHYHDHVGVGPHCAREVWDLVPPHRTEVAVCASGNSWLGA